MRGGTSNVLRPALLSVLAAAGPLATALGCNAVLGIDKAEYDPGFDPSQTASANAASSSTGSSGTTTGGEDQPECIGPGSYKEPSGEECSEPSDECELECTGLGVLTECLASSSCRKALDEYRQCLGSDCSGSATCSECLAAKAPEENAPEAILGGCMSNPNCSGQQPASMCVLFCACMSDDAYCGQEDTPYREFQDCMTVCEAWNDPALAHCRWGHCEGAGTDKRHCGHAFDNNYCDPNAPPCEGRRKSGHYCESNAQCCTSCFEQVCQ